MADRESNPLVDQIRRGGVPLEVRMMAAEGALPLKPEDLVDLLEVMSRDEAKEVSELATKTYIEFPADTLLPLVKARDASAAVLAWTLQVRTDSKILEACLQNVATPDEAIAKQAAKLPEALAELVVINQTRLLRHMPLLEAIEANPSISRDQKRRLNELRETFSIGAEPEPAAQPPAAPVQAPAADVPAAPPKVEPAPEEKAPESPEEAAAPEATAEENSIEIDAEAAAAMLTDEEKKDERAVSKLQRLFSLRTGQKIKAALTEDSQARSFLIRDPNRLVALAVLGSPKITEAEIEGIAAMKNVNDEVLRKIGTNRDWTKKYTVVNSLVKNPRTPLPIAMGFISRLQPRDMKAISVDKNVPEAIRKSAQRFIKAAVQKGSRD
jgi:hypothetical protein